MAGKGGDYGSKAINTLAGAAAAFVARKALVFAWTKATGRKPPEKAEDPQVALGEALAWTLVVGVGVAVARVLAMRLATSQSGRQLSRPAGYTAE
jgi:hypothetical protein